MTLLNEVKLAAHARGLVFVNLNNSHCKAMKGKTPNELRDLAEEDEDRRKKWLFRADAKEMLDKFASKRPSSSAYCGASIPLTYKRKLFLQEEEMWRTDLAICMAYQVIDENGSLVTDCVGVAAFGAVDPQEFHAEFDEDRIQNAITNSSLLEIDLICVKPNSIKGTGTLLMLYVMAKELSRKKRNAPLYSGVLINLAEDRQGRAPLGNIAVRLGFENAAIPADDEGEYNYKILIENIEQKLANALPDMSNILRVCPTMPKSGLTYCV